MAGKPLLLTAESERQSRPASIPIHAPMLGATRNAGERCAGQSISIHAPLCGGRRASWRAPRQKSDFQSTPPARGATFCERVSMDEYRISIHAPCAGGDTCAAANRVIRNISSTLPVRGATRKKVDALNAEYISIYAPCGGDAQIYRLFIKYFCIFNPRPLCGGRPLTGRYTSSLALFQSTPPARGATARTVTINYLF